MKINKLYVVIGLIIAFTLFLELAAHADESDQASTITFSEPVQIPGQVLPAGTYLFKLVNSASDRHIVQILSPESTDVYATLQTIATERREPTGDTAVTFAEQGAGKPEVLVKWFYPGREIGSEFLYPKEKEKELAQDRQQTVVANQHTLPDSDTSGAGN